MAAKYANPTTILELAHNVRREGLNHRKSAAMLLERRSADPDGMSGYDAETYMLDRGRGSAMLDWAEGVIAMSSFQGATEELVREQAARRCQEGLRRARSYTSAVTRGEVDGWMRVADLLLGFLAR